ncbi:MAG: diguanylate cyclase [Patescibacteria group bacterium]|nr:diguanylate cyclase [Patescibacteria group bacterium]
MENKNKIEISPLQLQSSESPGSEKAPPAQKRNPDPETGPTQEQLDELTPAQWIEMEKDAVRQEYLNDPRKFQFEQRIIALDDPGLREQYEKIKAQQIELEAVAVYHSLTKEQLRGEYQKLCRNPVSGLRVRPLFYKELNAQVENQLEQILSRGGEIPIAEWKNLSDQEFNQLISGLEPEKLKQVPLSVMLGDVSYLSLANKFGHHVGDRLLENVGQSAIQVTEDYQKKHPDKKPSSVEFFHLGGDEFTGLFSADLEQSRSIVQELTQTINQTPLRDIGVFQKNFEEKMHLDIGLSHFSEAVAACQEFLKQARIQESKAPIKRSFKTFIDIWTGIADKRQSLDKALTRVTQLKKYFVYSREVYNDIVPTQRKGALGMSNDELEALIQREKQGENWNNIVKQFILGKNAQNQKMQLEEQKDNPQIQSIKNNIINQFAAQNF